jgi:GT2 family glycosyltransferase
MNEIGVIISSFNRADLLKEALASLLRVLPALQREAIIVIFDAGSRDGSRELIEDFQNKSPFPLYLIGPSKEDNSFAAGVNEAARFIGSARPSTEFLLLFETDNYLQSAKPLRSALTLLQQRQHLGAVGFTVQKHCGSLAGFGCGFPATSHFILGPQMTHAFKMDRPKLDWQNTSEIIWSECDVVYTSPAFVRWIAWNATNGFDASAFPFADCDLDWARRLREAGFRQAVIRTSDVVHDNHDRPSAWSATRALHFHRARYRLLQRWQKVSRRQLLPFLFLRHAIEIAIMVLKVFPVKGYFSRLQKRWTLLRGAFSGYE